MLNRRNAKAALITTAVASVIAVSAVRLSAPTVEHKFVHAAETIAAIQKVEATCHHDVICGGVHSVQDIKILGAWPDFDTRSAKHFALPYNIWAYVSYRQDGRIYTTHQKREIPKGTMVFEDAFGHIILERCGNEIETSPNDVGGAQMGEPLDIFPPAQAPTIEPTPDSNIPDGGITVPPPNEPPISTNPTPPTGSNPCCGVVIPPKTPISVGEPSDLAFLILGLPSLLLFWVGVKCIRRKP